MQPPRLRSLLCRLALLLSTIVLLAAPPTTVGAQGAIAVTELVTVLAFGGSDRLLVQNDAGVRYRVQYIGLRGPTSASLQSADASAFHGPRVIGQRVRLESDGPDEAGGYKLRHAFLADDPVPIGAAGVGAGWSRVVPYPTVQRFRSLYQQLQAQAMAEQRGLWDPSVLGPAASWHGAHGGPAEYVAAHPALHEALNLLSTIPTGQQVTDRLVGLGGAVGLQMLPEEVGGYADPLGYRAVLNAELLRGDPRAVAAVLAHEGSHLISFARQAEGTISPSCFDLEIAAHGVHAQVWSEFYGPGGKPDARDPRDISNNHLLRFHQQGDLANYVRLSSDYQAQCASERGRL